MGSLQEVKQDAPLLDILHNSFPCLCPWPWPWPLPFYVSIRKRVFLFFLGMGKGKGMGKEMNDARGSLVCVRSVFKPGNDNHFFSFELAFLF